MPIILMFTVADSTEAPTLTADPQASYLLADPG